ncbi:MAG: signal peptidase I [Candidatus Moduliflexus flocculans]|nr:signal peptidase I [Candidatus Moduliflexus flocculans]
MLDILETVILAVILYFGINAISARVRVDGLSMNPTLQHGEYVLVSRLTYRAGEPERGDIIVFSFPVDQKQDLIKRVIGLPGETVSIRNGEVLINGVKLEEPYIAQSPVYNGDLDGRRRGTLRAGRQPQRLEGLASMGTAPHREHHRQGIVDLLALRPNGNSSTTPRKYLSLKQDTAR